MKSKIMAFLLSLIILCLSVFASGDSAADISVYLDTINIMVNDSPVNAPNILYNGITYIPLRAVSESLGADVQWDDKTKTASITSTNTLVRTNGIGLIVSCTVNYMNALNIIQSMGESYISNTFLLNEFLMAAYAPKYYDVETFKNAYDENIKSLNEIYDSDNENNIYTNFAYNNAVYADGSDNNDRIKDISNMLDNIKKAKYIISEAYSYVLQLQSTSKSDYYNKCIDKIAEARNILYDVNNCASSIYADMRLKLTDYETYKNFSE